MTFITPMHASQPHGDRRLSQQSSQKAKCVQGQRDQGSADNQGGQVTQKQAVEAESRCRHGCDCSVCVHNTLRGTSAMAGAVRVKRQCPWGQLAHTGLDRGLWQPSSWRVLSTGDEELRPREAWDSDVGWARAVRRLQPSVLRKEANNTPRAANGNVQSVPGPQLRAPDPARAGWAAGRGHVAGCTAF